MLLLGVALLMVQGGTPGSSGRWWLAHYDDERMIFVDSLTVRKSDDGLSRIWSQNVRRSVEHKVRSTVHDYLVDCDGHRLQQQSANAYGDDGEVVISEDERKDAVTVVPDSIGETVMIMACSPSVTDWRNMEARPVERLPTKVTHDFYFLVDLGMPSSAAAKIAVLKAADHQEFIADTIEQFAPASKKRTLREAYGLPDAST